MKLLIKALIKFLLGFLLVCVLLFAPAGTFNYMNGWLFLGLLFIPMLFLGIVLFIKAPALLEKRMSAKEDNNTQKCVVALSGIIFIGGFVVAGLDFRFNWSHVPTCVIITASVILLFSYALYAQVMRENAYLSRKIEVQDNQKVVDTGLYGIIRHPMYAVTVWLFLSIPVVLGSWWSLLCFIPYIALIVVRICNEEKLLEAELDGYKSKISRLKRPITKTEITAATCVAP